MVNNKNVCKIKQCILCLTFLLSEFIESVLVSFVDIIFVTFVDTLSLTFTYSSNTIITKLTTLLFKYLLF